MPYVVSPPLQSAPSRRDIERLAAALQRKNARNGIIVCGPQPDPALAPAVSALARALDYPVLADCLSQVRCGHHDRSMIVDSYDAFLREPSVVDSLAPGVVLRFGGLPVSATLGRYLQRHRSAHHILVDQAGWRDPFHLSTEVWHAEPVMFCDALASAVKGQRPPGDWSKRWRGINAVAGAVLASELIRFPGMFEGRVFSELAQLLPENAVLFAGNSMPIRDMDSFFPSGARAVRFMANRGASGIDGVVSSALGAGAGAEGKLVLVLGDISLYHDMNGLLAARSHGINITIVVINNNGGGIFSFLPQSGCEDVFERYFATPHGLTFRAAAELYGLGYHKVEDWPALAGAVRESLVGSATTIIEAPGERKSNLELHRRAWDAVANRM